MKLSTRTLVQLSLLIAISIVLTRFATLRIFIGPYEGIRIGFGSAPLALAGIWFGPAAGAVAGVIADLLGVYIDPMKTVILPEFTIISALYGIIPVIVLRLMQREKNFGIWSIGIAIGIKQFITSLILVPFVLQYRFGIPVAATIVPRIIATVIYIPVVSAFIVVLHHRLKGFVTLSGYMKV